MVDELKIVSILAVALSVSFTSGYIAQRLKFSPILGYLLAGYLIGPNSPGFIADQELSHQLANIGITLLMFAVGLNFSWKEINSVKKIVVPGAIISSLLSTLAGFSLGTLLGETLSASLVVGIAISVSSTVVIVRVLTDQHLLRSLQGYLVIGWTIIEDLISVFALLLLPTLVTSFTASSSTDLVTIATSILIMLLKISALGLIVYFIGERFIESILRIIARTKSHELFTLCVLAWVFLIATCSTYFFGISLALGAFIAGIIIGNTTLSHQVMVNALPMRDAFAVLFFLSVGMLFNPSALNSNIPLFFGVLSITLLFRPLLAFVIVRMAKYPTYVGLTTAISISQIGEYSFIFLEESSRHNILPDNAYDIIIACSFISIALNPILFKLLDPWMNPKNAKRLTKIANVSLRHLYESDISKASLLPRAMIIGYGVVGKAATNCLIEKYQVVVIDQDIDIVSNFENQNFEVLYGDATTLLLLEQGQIGNVDLIVITTPKPETTKSIIDIVQHANPNITILARVNFQEDYDLIKSEHIPIVCDEEEAAKKMVTLIQEMTNVGKNATP